MCTAIALNLRISGKELGLSRLVPSFFYFFMKNTENTKKTLNSNSKNSFHKKTNTKTVLKNSFQKQESNMPIVFHTSNSKFFLSYKA